MQKRHVFMVMAVAAACFAAPRHAAAKGKLFLNGVEVEGLANQSFQSCEVRFDQEGNVWITAKGYSVKVGGKAGKPTTVKTTSPAPDMAHETTPAGSEPATPAAGAKLTKRYWIVAMQPRVGAAQYDINVFINGKFVRKVKSSAAQTVVDVTDHVKVGKNTVHFAAVKAYGEGGKRFSSSPEDTFKVLLGEGAMGKGSIMISAPLAEMTRTAQETENKTSQSTFTGR